MDINKLYNMDCRDGLKQMISENLKADCVITSPPYWSLRDYGIEPTIWDGDSNCEHDWKTTEAKVRMNEANWKEGNEVVKENTLHKLIQKQDFLCIKCGAWKGNLGLEPDFKLYINHLCDIFDLIKEVLKKSGTCWVNLGDSYSSGGMSGSKQYFEKGHIQFGKIDPKGKYQAPKKVKDVPPKCLLMIPQRFAIEMINRGWILRNVIIWNKPNPMPSSARDRFTIDFEYIYFFVKNKIYWFEQQREKLSENPATKERYKYKVGNQSKRKDNNQPLVKPGKVFSKYFPQDLEKVRGYSIKPNLIENPQHHGNNIFTYIGGRNKRTTWVIPTKPTDEPHFATFPNELVEPMIRAGCPEFVCSKCGKPYRKIYKSTKKYEQLKKKWKYVNMGGTIQTGRNRQTGYPGHISKEQIFKGYSNCGCKNGREAGLMLDPFAGIGTSLLTAWNLGRDFIGFEISPKYCQIAQEKYLVKCNYDRITKFIEA